MKKQLGTLLILLVTIGANAQNSTVYDSVLAKKLGADDYGMKHYVLAFLKKGAFIAADKKRSDELMTGHLKNIFKLADEGKMVVAGPLMDDTGLEGIFVFNVKTVEEAAALSETDPAIKAGMFAMEYHPWYASAALMEIVRIHNTLQKKKPY